VHTCFDDDLGTLPIFINSQVTLEYIPRSVHNTMIIYPDRTPTTQSTIASFKKSVFVTSCVFSSKMYNPATKGKAEWKEDPLKAINNKPKKKVSGLLKALIKSK